MNVWHEKIQSLKLNFNLSVMLSWLLHMPSSKKMPFSRPFFFFLFKMFLFPPRDMHAKECGPNFIGLCDKMTSINGETLLNFLRNVSFTGKSNSFLCTTQYTLNINVRKRSCSYKKSRKIWAACKRSVFLLLLNPHDQHLGKYPRTLWDMGSNIKLWSQRSITTPKISTKHLKFA